jgi:imidazolonepropionase-like amidohydrolase
MGIGAPEELPMVAALAVKGGLPRDAALKAVTIGAAEILGVSKQIGSLEPGKSADLVILSGDPLHYRTQVRTVIVKGSEVPR